MEVSADAHSEVTADKKNMTARCSEELSSAHQPEDLDSATFSFVIEEFWKLCRVFCPRHTVLWKHYDVPKTSDQDLTIPQQRLSFSTEILQFQGLSAHKAIAELWFPGRYFMHWVEIINHFYLDSIISRCQVTLI